MASFKSLIADDSFSQFRNLTHYEVQNMDQRVIYFTTD